MRYEDRSTGMSAGAPVLEPELALNYGERNEGVKSEAAAARRILVFCAFIAIVVCVADAMITRGMRRVKTGQFGVTNRIMEGRVNAEVVITGSSRALSHYDPRIIEAETGLTAFNIGRNGSQTDMQLAVLRAYLAHNRRPKVILHNLDSFSLEATRTVYDPGQYVPYLYEEELYRPLQQIDRGTWKSRYLPLYGYVVNDMSLSWMLGVGAWVGWSPPEQYFSGFNPRANRWTDEFERFKSANTGGVRWPIDPEGKLGLSGIVELCRDRGISLIFVYSPEYVEMQHLTQNRGEVFRYFAELAAAGGVQLWDYSDWPHAGETRYFQNSQHLNAEGAGLFSSDLAARLKGNLASR